MEKKIYDLMNWPEIEAVVYSECDNPHALLGPHVTEDGILIQAFLPDAVSAVVKAGAKRSYPMELVDDAGYFAVLVSGKSIFKYSILVTYADEVQQEIVDPYEFPSLFTEKDLKRFAAGIHYEIYDKLGAHPAVIKSMQGIHFAVWAPFAVRVSVVGDFNLWDGRKHQMTRLGDSGIFEIFIPQLNPGELYKFEIKMKGGQTVLKADPYANYAEMRPNTASVVWDIRDYQWNDGDWMKKRASGNAKEQPMSIYEVHLGSWLRKEPSLGEDGEPVLGSEFCGYRELAEKLAAYVKEMGYTHIELMPVMEHPLDASWGYQVTGYYAPTSRYGTPDDFMYFMDYMHQNNIGVILDWVPAHFPRDSFGLAAFDGTCLYEHKDPRKGAHPHWGTLIYNYARPEVSNFLIANALFWVERYHADGIRMDAVASMLYLDYGKNDGEWIPNIYGGHENLEAVEFLKHLNSVMKKRKDGALMIAEESTAWPQVTGKTEDGSLGFDFKWNMGWMNDFLGYMRYDPYFRNHHYGELTFSMIYAYSEEFILVFSHDEVVHGKGSMINKMPGDTMEFKLANLRAAYGFMMVHPGKKLLFMGQDFAQPDEWNENKSLDWELLEKPEHKELNTYVKALNQLYRNCPALYEMDGEPDGFEWINCTDAKENMVVFLRKTKRKEDTLLVICNFEPVAKEKFTTGVPYKGKYKEIFNSDAKEFGGGGDTNPRLKTSKAQECDERADSITVKVAPLSISVFQYIPHVEAVTTNAAAKSQKKSESPKAAGAAKRLSKGEPEKTVTEETVKSGAEAADGPASEVSAVSAAKKQDSAAKTAKPKAAKKKSVATKAVEAIKKSVLKGEEPDKEDGGTL